MDNIENITKLNKKRFSLSKKIIGTPDQKEKARLTAECTAIDDEMEKMGYDAQRMQTQILLKAVQLDLFPEAAAQHTVQAQELRLKNLKEVELSQNSSVVPTILTNARFFAPAQYGRRAFFEEWRPVPVWGFPGIECHNRIYQLNQFDLTIKLGLDHYAKLRPDLIACFSANEFLKFIQRPTTGSYRRLLAQAIERLQAAQIAIRYENEFETDKGVEKKVYRVKGPIVGRTVEDVTDKLYAVSLCKEINDLLGVSDWSFQNMKQRAELGRNESALEWHAFLSSHQGPEFWIKKNDLMAIWGTNYQTPGSFLKDFKRRVLKPLKDIDFVTNVKEKDTALGITYKRRK
jgi:hypothetical protein